MEKYSLKWDNFQTNVSCSFIKLRSEKDFFDVTLVSEDEVQISSHKVILSASSDFFKNVLRKSSHANPMIYLSGVKAKELHFVMDYIYNGEVQLYQEDLDTFLDVGKRLKIEGLLSSSQNDGLLSLSCSQIQENKKNTSLDFLSNSYIKEEADHEDVIEEAQSFTEQLKPDTKPRSQSQPSQVIYAKEATDQLIIKNSDNYECRSCGKTVRRSSDMRRHVEVHIEGLSFVCQTCGITFR